MVEVTKTILQCMYTNKLVVLTTALSGFTLVAVSWRTVVMKGLLW